MEKSIFCNLRLMNPFSGTLFSGTSRAGKGAGWADRGVGFGLGEGKDKEWAGGEYIPKFRILKCDMKWAWGLGPGVSCMHSLQTVLLVGALEHCCNPNFPAVLTAVGSALRPVAVRREVEVEQTYFPGEIALVATASPWKNPFSAICA